jgi:hypothetical protein
MLLRIIVLLQPSRIETDILSSKAGRINRFCWKKRPRISSPLRRAVPTPQVGRSLDGFPFVGRTAARNRPSLADRSCLCPRRLSVHSSLEPHEAPVTQLADLVAKIVRIEGPIHIDEVARRISSAFGKSRTGNRIAEATERATRLALQKEPALTRSASFLLTNEQAENPPVRNRSDENGSLLKVACLPPMEIRAAARRIRLESGEMAFDDLARAVARLLGFRRVGSDLAAVISKVLSSGIEGGETAQSELKQKRQKN